LTYATTRNKVDGAAGFLTFLMSNTGQREYMNLGYRPAAVPVRIVRLTKG
jgi:ABC-type sulfate transport system substrate-binding protein